MKGKKFDAHEKHFKEKEIKLNKEVNYLKDKYCEIYKENIKLSEENIKFKDENLDIKIKYEKLLEYLKISDNDIKVSLQRDKSLSQITEIFNAVKGPCIY